MDARWFPVEIEREIFEIAAIHHPECIPTFLQVCRRVHTWLEPILYRVLVIRTAWEHQHVPPAIRSKTLAFLQNSVQHVLLNLFWSNEMPSQEMDTYKTLFENCPGIKDVSLHMNPGPGLIFSLNKLRPQKLALPVPPISCTWGLASFTHPFFSSVTHLRLTQLCAYRSFEDENDLSRVTSLPALTHLALSPSIAKDILSRVVAAECPRLVIIVVVAFIREFAVSFVDKLTTIDPRVLVMAMESHESDWRRGAWRGDDCWVRAAAFLEKRRAGQAHGYLLDETKPRSPE
ncbi:hypothetical protein MSAN_00258300 [Mycena sanguinolenta]|uniref:Uncharacterized protein n=1 Tax=Mycena sanguinolenta TaxID=230812 RepID=A0A8H6ZG23_9AGAR|nr:hypothetical protein MSAN_00258300 [Mycena sanguinolenta]